MTIAIRFPSVGANVTEGTVGRWHKREGEAVAEGYAVVEIITSKATFDVESPATGTLGNILAPEKSIVPVGYILSAIDADDESINAFAEENAALIKKFKASAQSETVTNRTTKKVRATPGARRLAKELGVELSAIEPQAGSSVIREDDVKAAAGKG